MPNVKSAKKRVKTNEKRRIRNRQARATLRTALKQANVSVAPGSDLEAAKTVTQQAFSLIGKTAKKGIIHRNKAARQESRLMKKLNALAASK
ncbi:MAG TPA: 30S ribosomal protein S20 [Candidatus Sumerlaeota bacterium]|nr:30S ribosomal protein S20 [Candidatus Sumerlaeota bacterium]HPS01872.1 30S ribosomal protein S20 [Candidatus Sumerlaeota bacterium]